MMHKEMRYKEMIARMVIIALLVSIILGLATSVYLKTRAVSDLAKIDAKKTSQLVFESLYSAMSKGWTKDELHSIITRLNNVEPTMKINVYRSDKVAELYGDIEADKTARTNDAAIVSAMRGEEQLITTSDQHLRYLYPIRVKKECISCHTNAKEGDVNGVIDIVYPISGLKISLSLMLNSFLTFFVLFIIAVFAAFFYNLNRFFVRPLEAFITTMREIIVKNDLTTRVAINSRIYEVKNIERFFNKLLDSLQDYYEKLIELSEKDFLTKLLNRKKFEEFIEYEISRATRHDYKFSVIMMDIDNFKFVNDTYGHQVGDLVLVEVSMILANNVRNSDVVARLGGDEFAIMLVQTPLDEAKVVIEKLRESLQQTEIAVPSDKIKVTASFGIIEFPTQGESKELMMTGADIAMYKAKRAGKNTIATAEKDDVMLSTALFKAGEFIRKAIEEDRIVPFFQPIFDIKLNRIHGYEVLARIKDGDAYIGAGQFIEMAEHMNLSRTIDKIVMRKALEVREQKNIEAYMFFNISSKAFNDSDFIEDTIAMMHKYGIFSHQKIVLEITEREALPNITEFIPLISEMRKRNISFALDDFGTGFSSFVYLKYLDVDIIKIDGGFVKNITTNQKDEIFVRHINEISHEFGKTTIAEYVEDEETLQLLKKIGVEYAQGYYIGKPGLL